jgi:hypothetical protein
MEILMFSYILSDVFHGPMQICSQVQARFTLQLRQRTQTTPIRVPDGQFLSLETPSALTAFFWGWEKTMCLIKADFHLDRSAADEVIDGL